MAYTPQELDRMRDLGVAHTLRKPFDQPALAAVLSALLSPKPAKEATPQCP